jgi:hypothetical protein
MGGRREGCREARGEKLEGCCKEQGQLVKASKEGLGSKWAVVPMMTMMINAQVICLGNGLQPMRRRLFLKQIPHELVIGGIARSIKTVELPIDLQQRLKRFLPCTDEGKGDESSPGPSKRRICAKCTTQTGIRTLSKYECKKCKNPICMTHANFVYDFCYDVNTFSD